MSEHHDFKKEWEKTRAQLIKFSQEAAKIAKKGEEELVKFSKQGKLRVDSSTLSLKREKLYYLIGKEYAKANVATHATPKLEKLSGEMAKIDKEQAVLTRKLKKRAKKK